MSFWDTSFLWFEAVVASVAVATICAMVGVYAILRRVVFLPATLSQVSGFGVVISFVLIGWFPALESTVAFDPALVALLITLLAAVLLGWMPEPRRLSREAVIGIAFISASALVILVGDRIPQEAHHIEDILFGNAVVVERSQMYVALITAALVMILHIFMLRPFLLASHDPETARAHGVPVRAIDAVLFLSMGVTIAVATRTIGAMPVFAYSVLPAAAALMMFNDIRLVLLTAALMGALSAFFGYWLSFVWEFPTGACTVVLSAALLIPAKITGLVLEQFRRS